ncbi:hypothetical protein [Lacrimispora indolis]|uniref:hypothetical protein n=1 Tax=Lacrimispora indolis TaxID=69825 RepID=UPI000402708C|nr:hypothetical protein [[Clostridium] methoxybenzovorans]
MKVGDFINEYDELKIYRGEDYVISNHIRLHQPTLSEICDYGEERYYSMIYQLTATPQSMKFQLWDSGVDYTTITAYQLFYSLIVGMYLKEQTSILFGDLDFTKFKRGTRKDNGEVVLWQVVDDEEVLFDEFTYELVANYLRKMHFIGKDEKMPANNSTKIALIEDARDEYEKNKNKTNHSQLKNFISTMINIEGFKYNHSQVWDMKINAFMDSVRRISKIKNAELLLQSGYSGYGIDLKKIDKKQLDWQGELE